MSFFRANVPFASFVESLAKLKADPFLRLVFFSFQKPDTIFHYTYTALVLPFTYQTLCPQQITNQFYHLNLHVHAAYYIIAMFIFFSVLYFCIFFCTW